MKNKNNQSLNNVEPKDERERLVLTGVVLEHIKGKFRVQINKDHTILAVLSGKVRINNVKVLIGDTVDVEVSEYNLSLGRIVFRHKN